MPTARNARVLPPPRARTNGTSPLPDRRAAPQNNINTPNRPERPWSAALAVSWRPVLAAVWLAGSLAWLGCVVLRVRRFRRALRCATPAPAEIQERAETLAVRLGLRRAPGVWIVPGGVAPLVWGLGRRARLIVPGSLWERLDPDQRDALILHELAHVRRGDPWVRLLELVATGLYWWHPTVWWARRALSEVEEQCCDAWVVWATSPRSGRAYATALVEAVDYLCEAQPALPPGASGMSRARHLSRRIAMIMKGTTPRALSWLGLLALIAVGALSLTWLPIWAEPGQGTNTPQPTTIAGSPAVLPYGVANPQADRQRIQQEIEILNAQLDQKKAALRRAEAQRRLAQLELDNAKKLANQNVISSEEVALHEGEAEIAEADVAASQAELHEWEIRLKGAQRMLGTIKTPSATIKPAPRSPVPGSASSRPGRGALPGGSGNVVRCDRCTHRPRRSGPSEPQAGRPGDPGPRERSIEAD